MRTKHVIVVPYDPVWKENFLEISNEIEAILGSLCLKIVHVGSTSVEGLSAKPIIDIDVVIKDNSVLDVVIDKLSQIGYYYEGNLGITGREAFAYVGKTHLAVHHLYVCPENSDELKRHINFRNYLRLHPKAVEEYSRIKVEGARLFPDSIEQYLEYKTPFIESVYQKIYQDINFNG